MFLNIVMVLLAYAGLTLLAIYPERVNGLEPWVCTGDIRRYTIHMVLYIKLVFVLSLVFTSVCDVLGADVDGAYSLITSGLIILIAVLYEVKISNTAYRNSCRRWWWIFNRDPFAERLRK